MRTTIATLLIASTSICSAQLLDFYGDTIPTVVYRSNDGQHVDAGLNPRPDVIAASEHSALHLYMREKSEVSFVRFAHDTAVMPIDTSYRIDMKMAGESYQVNPVLEKQQPGFNNYYLGHVPDGVEEVYAYASAVYYEVYPDVDLVFYSGSTGAKMAFVVHPGGDVDNILLHFTGQDSIHIDWAGALRFYLHGQFMRWDTAVAYQIAGGVPVSVSSGADYITNSGGDYISFVVDTFDTSRDLILQIGAPPAMGAGGSNTRNLTWCSFVSADEFSCVEVDEDGNPYTCGYTWNANFPINPGTQVYNAFIGYFSGECDAVIVKFRASDKRWLWGTFYAGSITAIEGNAAMTKASKLAVYTGSDSTYDYVFATGTTNCEDFNSAHYPFSIFSSAVHEGYLGGKSRAWIGAFTKEKGWRKWATTHGVSDTTATTEDGLAVAVNDNGKVAFGGWSELDPLWCQIPAFPAVTPAGAFTRSEGSGFFVVFDDDYQIEWATPWGQRGPMNRVTDMRYKGNDLWLCGKSEGWCVGTAPLDTVSPDSGYFQSYGGGGYVAKINTATYQVELCTAWGGPGGVTFKGLEVTSKDLWVVGEAFDGLGGYPALPHFPDPGCNLYDTLSIDNQTEGVLLHFTLSPWDLVYATYVGEDSLANGEDADDVLLDVTADPSGRIFITGETRSGPDLTDDLTPQYFFQELHSGAPYRDAILLGFDDQDPPQLFWNSAFAGSYSDRGYGVAASANEIYLCGSTASDFWWQNFPIHEFDPLDPFDFFLDLNFGGAGDDPTGFPYDWNGVQDEILWDFETAGHTAFIASFYSDDDVLVPEPPTVAQDQMMVLQDVSGAHCVIVLPDDQKWTLATVNTLGQVVKSGLSNGRRTLWDLSTLASGVYVITATSTDGTLLSKKILRP